MPKIRVGEVLRGTRNLRHWLRTASILRNVESLHRNGMGFLDPGFGKNLYTPQKDDSFIVAANTPFHFCVWSPRQNVSLVFINPSGRYEKEVTPYMSPALFATWFVRTNEYNLDLTKWPHFAYYIWALVQMNALALPNQPYALNLGKTHNTPFTLQMDVNNAEMRNAVAGFALQAGRWGRLRPNALRNWHSRRYGVDYAGHGLRIQQVHSMQMSIREYLSHARRFLGPKGSLSNGMLEKGVLEALQRYKENPAAGIEAALKNYL